MEDQVIPYQRRRRAMRGSAAMPPTRPDRPRPTPASSSTGNGKGQPPRPPNAWILYRSDKLKELATSQAPGPRKPQAEISKIISQMWQAEGPDTKGRYEARAEEKKAEHAALYPDYKFAPMKKEDKAMLRKAQRQEKEEIRAQERNRKKRKGKGRADEDEEDYDAPRPLPYPLQRPAQSWYPPSTYGPQGRYAPAQPQDDQAAFAAAGWSAAVDPQGKAPEQDAPFRADAYQQPEYEGEDEWAGEEGEWNVEEAWAGRTRRGAVWDEEQVAPRPQEDPVAQWTSIPTHSPPEQPQSLTITLPATLNPSEQPYTFNLDFDMPMVAFSGDPDANVAVSLGGMNLGESSSANPNVGLNELLRAPLPDISVSFPDFMGNAQGNGNFDVLSTENEEWWSALMEAAVIPEERSYDAGPSHLMAYDDQPAAAPSYDQHAPQSRPAPIHTQSLPTFSHGLPSPDGDQQGGRSRAASSAAYPGQMPGAFPEPYHDSYTPQPQQYQQPYQEYNPSPFAQIASTRNWRSQQRSRAPSFPAPPQNNTFPYQPSFSSPNPFPSPSGAGPFSSPSGAGPLPSPSGAVPRPQPTYTAPPPRPPPSLPPPNKGKEKDPEAFDYSGWGSQYAAQPPTPAEDAVRRGVGVSH
ncbi:unnamed protein product [Rhizoctonia solani]|uniref:HMG box domain-containing protein n=1 Tax=Rhizoctonia solani TaxID=456999 RepID=A0A8H3HZ78_9AGAM|nr:unnamed protein product [Rhizoctonia solani]